MKVNVKRYHTPDYVIRYAAEQAGMDFERLREVSV